MHCHNTLQLSARPPLVSTAHVHLVLRMCRVLAARAPALAVQMLEMGYADTLGAIVASNVVVGGKQQIVVNSLPPQQMHEVVALCA